MAEISIDKLSIDLSADANVAVNSLENLVGRLNSLNNALKNTTGFTKLTNSLTKMNTTLSSLKTNSTGITDLVNSLKPLSEIQKSTGLTSSLNQLKKIPEITEKLNPEVISQFATRIKTLTVALAPLATQMKKVSAGFSAFPSKLQKVNNAVTKTTSSAKKGRSEFQQFFAFGNIAARFMILQQAANAVGGFITESNAYVENLNLFTVSMGAAAEESTKFVNAFSEGLGLDPSQVMRNMGMFNTLIEGFGIANSQAAMMSKNMTQLSYDMSSFLNIPVEDAMQKIKSGLAGEIEPLTKIAA